jgi:general L-amino acid transport system permease protein
MSILSTGSLAPAALWRRRRTRRYLIQAAFLAVVGLIVAYLIVQALGLDLDFDFLSGPGGFSIPHQWLTGYDTSDTRLAAYATGVVNTIRLVAVGIVLATIIGVVAGVARLSKNWLVSRIATFYVETIRNTPLLVQVIFWYTVVFLELPEIAENRTLFGAFYLSNRALALPFVESHGAFGIWILILLAGAASAWWTRARLLRREDDSGQRSFATPSAALLFAVVGGLGFLATGTPLSADLPTTDVTDFGIRTIDGGMQVTPEFAAILLGLVLYTGAFIAEIVRGSIQALPVGQGEAAAALGLSAYQRMTLIILPQALRIMIPPLTNQYLNLTKNSSLAVAIAFPELVFVGTTIINNIGHAVPVFILIWATYLALSLIISVAMNGLNRRVQLADH